MKCSHCRGKFSQKRVRFCPFCGQELLLRPTERRRVVIAFVELSEMAVRKGRVEPVDLRDTRDQCFRTFQEIVLDYGGDAISVQGDQMVFAMGLERTHGSDAIRIFETIDALQRELAQLTTRNDITATLRVGTSVGSASISFIQKKRNVEGPAFDEARDLVRRAKPGVVLTSRNLSKLADTFYDFQACEREGASETTYRCVGRKVRWRKEYPFIGRQSELDRLLDLKGPSSLLVQGEAGVGKTRLLHEFRRRLDRKGVLHFTLYLDTPGRAFHLPFEAFLRRVVSQAGTESQTGEEVWRAAFEDEEAWTRIEPDRIGSILRAAMGGILQRSSAVVIVEDCHRATPSVWSILEALKEPDGNHPLILVGASRIPHAFFGDVLELKGLTGESAKELFMTAGGADRPGKQGDWLRAVTRCHGNPFLILELSRFNPRGESLKPLLDGPTRFLLDSAIDSLFPFEQELVRKASILGPRFPVDALARMAHLKVDRARMQLQGTGLFEWPEGDAALFRHDLLQEVAYDRIDEATRKVWHEEAGDVLKEMKQPPEEIAHHYVRSGNTLVALRTALAAARRLSRLPRRDEAVAYLKHAERCAEAAKQGRLLLQVYELEFELATPTLSETEALERLETFAKHPLLLKEAHTKSRLGLMRARFYYEKRLYEKAEKLLKGVRRLATPEHAIARGLLEVRILAGQGRRQEATRMAMKWLTDRSLGPGERGQFWIILGRAAYADGEMAAAADFYQKCLSEWTKTDDVLSVRKALRNLGNIYFSQSDYKKARATFEEACELALQLGDLEGYVETLVSLGQSNELLLQIDIALRNYERAYESTKELRNEALPHRVCVFWAELMMLLGDSIRAQELVGPAFEYYSRNRDPYFFPKTMRLQADVLSVQDPTKALALLDAALALPEAYLEQRQLTLIRKCDLLLASEKIREAGEAFDELKRTSVPQRSSQRVRIHQARLALQLNVPDPKAASREARKILDETREAPDPLARRALLGAMAEFDAGSEEEWLFLSKEIDEAIPRKYRRN